MVAGEESQVQPADDLLLVLASGLVAPCVGIPQCARDLQLSGDDTEQRRRRRLLDAQGSARLTQVAKLNRNSQPVLRPAMLPNKGAVGSVQALMSDEFTLIGREREQGIALGGCQYFAARHGFPSIPELA